MSPCVLGLGIIICIWRTAHWFKHDNRYNCYLVHFCHMRKGWHEGDLMGYYPSRTYINPVTYCGVLVIFPCWGQGEFKPPETFQVSWIEAKPTKIGYFHIFGGWFDLHVTLKWPCNDHGVTPLWIPITIHVTMCTWVGIHQMYLRYWPLVQTWQSLCYFVHFCHMRKGWHKGDLMGYCPSSLYITPV